MAEEDHDLPRQHGHLQTAIREHPEHHWIYARCRLEVGWRIFPWTSWRTPRPLTPFWTSWTRVSNMMLGYNFPPTLTSTLACNGSLVSLCWSTARLMMQCGGCQNMMPPSGRLFKDGTCWGVRIWRRSRSSWWPYAHPTWRRRRCRKPCSWSSVKITSLPWAERRRGVIVPAGATLPSMRRTTMIGKRFWGLRRAGVCRGVRPGRGVLSRRWSGCYAAGLWRGGLRHGVCSLSRCSQALHGFEAGSWILASCGS